MWPPSGINILGAPVNILWLDHPVRYNRYDDWLHWRFAKSIAKFCTVYFYAPKMHDKCHDMTPIPYRPEITLAELTKRLNLDIVILDTRASAYDEYWPKSIFPRHDIGNEWLPPDFGVCEDVRKICIEEDFHYETDVNWYRSKGFHFLFQRHYCQAIRDVGMPQIYLPFSVDTESFRPLGLDRDNKIGFASTKNARNELCRESIYLYREKAAEYLREVGFLAETTVLNHDKFHNEEYIEYLNKHVGYVSCGSLFGITPAKMFEIMACGGVLLTNKMPGIDILFDNDCYVEYTPCTIDVVDKASHVVNDAKYRNGIVENALRCIHSRHTHEIRIKQLFKHLGVKI